MDPKSQLFLARFQLNFQRWLGHPWKSCKLYLAKIIWIFIPLNETTTYENKNSSNPKMTSGVSMEEIK